MILLIIKIIIIFSSIILYNYKDTEFNNIPVFYNIGTIYDKLFALFFGILKKIVKIIISLGIINAISNLNPNIGFILSRFFIYHILFVIVGLIIGFSVVNLLKPGKNLKEYIQKQKLEPENKKNYNILDYILDSNILLDSEGILIYIFFSFLIGFGIKSMGSNELKNIIKNLNIVSREIINNIMKVGNIFLLFGIFKILKSTSIDYVTLFKYVFSVIISLFLFNFGALPIIYYIITKQNLFNHYLRSLPQIFYAFFTSSSNATLPISLNVGINKLNIREEIASIIFPLGCTFNMVGTCIFQIVCLIFGLQIIEENISILYIISSMLTIISFSWIAPGIPSAGYVLTAILFNNFGIPVKYIEVILLVDRILDMLRTTVNVYSDSVIASIINHLYPK